MAANCCIASQHFRSKSSTICPAWHLAAVRNCHPCPVSCAFLAVLPRGRRL